MTRAEFEIVKHLIMSGEKKTQRGLVHDTGISLGSINKTVTELCALKILALNSGRFLFVTELGIKEMEKYRVKRAVFIAAGFGSRLVPITLNTPKALVRVKGVRIIDTMLDAVTAAGIEDIVIVRGYLGEQFDQLIYKYPSIKFIENPAYLETNNISSAACARYLFQRSYILDSDLILKKPSLITPYQYSSNYIGAKVEKTDDWCLFTDKKKKIFKVAVGGTNCYRMFGISYWTEQDGIKMSEHIKNVYEMPGGKERYWDQVPLEYHIKDYDIEVRECSLDNITEIDTFTELKAADPIYDV